MAVIKKSRSNSAPLRRYQLCFVGSSFWIGRTLMKENAASQMILKASHRKPLSAPIIPEDHTRLELPTTPKHWLLFSHASQEHLVLLRVHEVHLQHLHMRQKGFVI